MSTPLKNNILLNSHQWDSNQLSQPQKPHRSSRPTKRSTIFAQDANDSDSDNEEDDDDGFELLTAENLFSTLLSRVRALTHRLNVNNETTTSNFPSTRFMSNLRQTHNSPFWNNDPFGRYEAINRRFYLS